MRAGRGIGLAHEHLKHVKEHYAPERLIITDQDPRSFGHEESLRKLFPDTPTLIIDHHVVQDYQDIGFIHPTLVYGVQGHVYPSAKLCYDLANAVTSVEDLSWLAALGILGDAGVPRFPTFLESVAEKNDYSRDADVYDTPLGAVADALDCAAAKDEETLQEYVEKLSKCETLLEAERLGNPAQEVRDELDKYLREGMDIAERDGPIVWLPIESEFGIAGWVTTILSFEFPHRIFAGYREQVDTYSVSLRHADATIHLGEIVRPLAERFGGGGGGHAPAAGARIPREHWSAFVAAFHDAVNNALESSKDS